VQSDRSDGKKGNKVSDPPLPPPPPLYRQYKARFVSDVNYADGTRVLPEQRFLKTWRFRNSGTNPWPEGVLVQSVSGDVLASNLGTPIPGIVLPGQEIDLSVQMMAPKMPGRYQQHFGLGVVANEQHFGQKMWLIEAMPAASMEHDTTALAKNTSPVQISTDYALKHVLVCTINPRAMCFAPDSSIVAVAGGIENVDIWNVKSGQMIRTIDGTKCETRASGFMHTHSHVNGMCTSPDNKWIALENNSHVASVWEIDSGKLVHVLQRVLDVCFSGDGKRIATSGHCGKGGREGFSVTVWDALSATPIRMFRNGHTTWMDL